MDVNRKIAEWADFVVSGSGKWISRDSFYTVYPAIAPVTSFEFWHSFLFPLIEKKGKWFSFVVEYEDLCAKAGEHEQHDWRYLYMNSKTERLAEALACVIDEEEDAQAVE